MVGLDSSIFLLVLNKINMNNEFWCRVHQRGKNPTMTSNLITSLIHKQDVLQRPSKLDYPIPAIIHREAPLIPRSQSLSSKVTDSHNPQSNTLTRSSMMSQAGSNSLSKLKPLNSDREVYEKQRQGREMDILSHAPKDYKDSIKVFPKMRYENYDKDYWRRKSFIEGLPLDAYNHYMPATKKTGQA